MLRLTLKPEPLAPGYARRHGRVLAVAATAAGALPAITGSVPEAWTVHYLLGVGVGLGLLAWLAARSPGGVAGRLLVAIATLTATVGMLDLVARPVLARFLYARPHDRYFVRFPPLPLLFRYAPDVAFVGRAYGDLAALAGDPALREYREVRFVTDAFGFRNEARPEGDRDLDVILLGDSFGVGNGTTQEQTWATLLQRGYGLAVYNLSMAGSPWHEWMNLTIESNRLRARPGTVVLWALVPSNDLDDYYHTGDVDSLPWQGWWGAWRVSLRTFQDHSPVRLSLARLARWRDPARMIEVDVAGAKVLFHPAYAERKDRTVPEVLAHRNFRAFAETFARMVEVTRSRGLRLAVVVVPGKEEIYGWLLDGAPAWSRGRGPSGFAVVVEAMCARARVPFLDLTPLLADAARAAWDDSRQLLWWRDDSHWNARGHAAVAALVQERLLAGLVGAR